MTMLLPSSRLGNWPGPLSESEPMARAQNFSLSDCQLPGLGPEVATACRSNTPLKIHGLVSRKHAQFVYAVVQESPQLKWGRLLWPRGHRGECEKKKRVSQLVESQA